MPAHALSPCEYVVIRIAPDPIRNESVAIGVALFEPRAGGFADVRLNGDWRRVRGLSPRFDAADLAGLEQDLRQRLSTHAPLWFSREYLLQLAQETFSHSLQFSPPAAVLAQDPAAELDRLYQQYAAPLEAPGPAVAAGARRRILQHLTRVFREERLPRLPSVYARRWLGSPDRFRFDMHYEDRVRAPHFIQAVALGEDEPAIKDLCFTVVRLRHALAALDVAAFGDAAFSDESAYHSELLAAAGVRLLTLDQAPAEAGRIRARLGLA